MKYQDFLKTLDGCPFCNLDKREIIRKNKYAKVILARAPYHKDHLLVVPNKHALNLFDLNRAEKIAVMELICWAEKKLRKFHNNLSILYREGNKVAIGKSVDHFHVNLIPDEQVGSVRINAKDRNIYSDKKSIEETEKIKERFRQS